MGGGGDEAASIDPGAEVVPVVEQGYAENFPAPGKRNVAERRRDPRRRARPPAVGLLNPAALDLRRFNLSKHPNDPPPSVRIHRQEVDDVRWKQSRRGGRSPG
jgi:hypothetical protein